MPRSPDEPEPGATTPRAHSEAIPTTTTSMVRGGGVVDLAAERPAALERIKACEDHRRVCAWLHRLAPLTVYYSRRRRDRWAA